MKLWRSTSHQVYCAFYPKVISSADCICIRFIRLWSHNARFFPCLKLKKNEDEPLKFTKYERTLLLLMNNGALIRFPAKVCNQTVPQGPQDPNSWMWWNKDNLVLTIKPGSVTRVKQQVQHPRFTRVKLWNKRKNKKKEKFPFSLFLRLLHTCEPGLTAVTCSFRNYRLTFLNIFPTVQRHVSLSQRAYARNVIDFEYIYIYILFSVSLWRRANARNVRPYYPYWQYTDLFIFRFVSLLCLRSTLRLYIYINIY